MFDPFLTEKQILRKLGGDKTPGKVLTFDGKPNPDAIVDGTMVKLSEEVYDINSIERITVNRNGDKVVYDKSELVVQQGLAIGTEDETFVVIVPNADIADLMGLEIGVYVAYFEDTENGFFTEKVEFTETIHPIDQKYLPGVCLPVVELSTLLDFDGVELTAEESAALDKAVGLPCIIKTELAGQPITAAFFYTASEGYPMFLLSTPNFALNISKVDNGFWYATIIA